MKKCWFRFLSCMILISLLVTSASPALSAEADPPKDVTAAAEDGEIPRPFMLEESPLEEGQVSGKWSYAIRKTDGYAVITGYSGDEEEIFIHMN